MSYCKVVCLGIMFNTMDLSLTINPDRLSEVLEIWGDCGGAHFSQQHELRVLLGKLHFVACCIWPGLIFESHLWNFLQETLLVGKVSITAEAQKDIAWWLKFMSLYNGVSMFRRNGPSLIVLYLVMPVWLVEAPGWRVSISMLNFQISFWLTGPALILWSWWW